MSNLAQAYAVKRRMKMAKGGEVTDYADVPLKEPDENESDNPYAQAMKKLDALDHYADGGMVDEEASGYEEMPEAEDKENEAANEEDMIGRIMMKRMSKGGMVANDVGVAEADKLPAEYDDLVLRDDDMEDADYTGANSGDMLSNDGEDERRKDIVARIMKSRMKKDRMPSPA